MTCPRCQHENRGGRRVLPRNAARRWRSPAPSAAPPAPARKFCHKCGAPSGPPPRRPRLAIRSPESYTPKHLAEKILTSKAALEGERKQVTVLFADLKGSMELLADRDPEEARKLLDPVLERMMEAVHRYEGTVNQVMGDGIMALFGAPLAHEDHAVRACYAALDMQARDPRYADEVRRTHGVTVQIRVGLNSGEVVVAGHRQRPPHGLHGGRARRPTWPRGWSSSRRPGTVLLTRRHARDWPKATSRSSRSGRCRSRGWRPRSRSTS